MPQAAHRHTRPSRGAWSRRRRNDVRDDEADSVERQDRRRHAGQQSRQGACRAHVVKIQARLPAADSRPPVRGDRAQLHALCPSRGISHPGSALVRQTAPDRGHWRRRCRQASRRLPLARPCTVPNGLRRIPARRDTRHAAKSGDVAATSAKSRRRRQLRRPYACDLRPTDGACRARRPRRTERASRPLDKARHRR